MHHFLVTINVQVVTVNGNVGLGCGGGLTRGSSPHPALSQDRFQSCYRFAGKSRQASHIWRYLRFVIPTYCLDLAQIQQSQWHFVTNTTFSLFFFFRQKAQRAAAARQNPTTSTSGSDQPCSRAWPSVTRHLQGGLVALLNGDGGGSFP